MTSRICICLALVFATVGAHGQSQPPVVKTTTAGVVIDVSVVDKHGQSIVDLAPADFELSEDGVKQQILSVRLVHAGVARSQDKAAAGAVPAPAASVTAVAPPAGAATPAADNAPSVTAILFDRLSLEVRPLARNAALAYVDTLSPPHDYAGVFLADLAFRKVQSFTNRREALQYAIELVAQTAPTNLSAEAERTRTPVRTQGLDVSTPPTAGAEYAAGSMTISERERRLYGTDPTDSEKMLTRMELRMEEGYSRFLTEYEGDTSLSGLRAAVNGLAMLPGRKSILYFSESLPITDRLKARFDTLIGQANRANIAIYTVDAAGLRVNSKEAEVKRNVTLAGAQGVGDAQRPDGAWTKGLETQEQMLSSRPTAVLGRLAKETGGFLLENTNDLGAGVARMQVERTTYYLLGYQSTNAALDGSFRRVNVKVKRSKVTVRARAGYLAVPVHQS
ncbi:MAG TPA: VWA domain-containing protein [Vicinamibacterales bacterium]|nr:VWA domain-containing protein [Vicinamibacterales bacterium]